MTSEDVHARLQALQFTLQSQESFQSDMDRRQWWETLQRLRVEQQQHPEQWDTKADGLLLQMHQIIAMTPIQHDSTLNSVHLSMNDSTAGGRNSNFQHERLSSASSSRLNHQPYTDDWERTSWESFSHLMQEVSAQMAQAFVGVRDRHSSGGNVGRPSQRSSMSGSSYYRRYSASAMAISDFGASETRNSSTTPDRRRSSLTQAVPNLIRSVANYLGITTEETFYCQICFEQVPISRSFTLTACAHVYCQSCLKSYLEIKLHEAQVRPECFYEVEGNRACSEVILQEDIHAVVSEALWKKYIIFKFNQENENGRQCPYCDHLQVHAGSSRPDCVCESCGNEFCFLHSIAHTGRTCADYAKEMAAMDSLNRSMINRISKPCPGCQTAVEKNGGCNHMKCIVCYTNFCWLCGDVIDDSVTPEHFQLWNINGCAGKQMTDVVHEKSKTREFFEQSARVLYLLIIGPLACLLTLLAALFSGGFAPCRKEHNSTFRQEFIACFTISGYLLLGPCALAAALVFGALLIAVAVCVMVVAIITSPVICGIAWVKGESIADRFRWYCHWVPGVRRLPFAQQRLQPTRAMSTIEEEPDSEMSPSNDTGFHAIV